MKNISLVLFIVVSVISNAQQITFKKIYAGAFGTRSKYLTELSNHNYFVGISGGSGVAILDSYGNFLHQHTYYNDTLLTLKQVKKYSDNLYYFSSSYYYTPDTCGIFPKVFPVLGKMDSLGNILSAHYYHINTDCRNWAGTFDIANDGGVIIGGGGDVEPGSYIMKVDSNENYTWSKHFGVDNGGVQFVKALADNNFLAGFNLDTAGVALAKLDSAGNFIWCKSYFRPKGYIHDCIVDYDGSYLVVGYTDSIRPFSPSMYPPYPAWFTPKYFMLKLDTSGSVIWCKGYDSNNHWLMHQDSKIINTLDGNHLIYATVLTSSTFIPLLIKTNISGDTLWTRVREASQHWYYPSSIIATYDGGYLMDGHIQGPAYGGVFLYKTDSLGYTYCNERYEPIYVYNLFPSDSDFTMTYVTGGYGVPAFVSDFAYSLPTVAIECSTAVESPAPWKRSISLFPNPTSGISTIHLPNGIFDISTLAITNALGEEIQKFQVSGTDKTEINLTNQPNGIYFITVTDGEGNKAMKKVVKM